ncbi:MAG: topoisomerase DNA-binding C4 zinc finger domain-containing protein [Acidobacteria bacterium]|nr:topoisomerase DNA-binding C4 zinc finger domain-containing protein [Acidobacteriota bacterium]
MRSVVIVDHPVQVKLAQRALGADFQVMVLPGAADDYLPKSTEASFHSFDPSRRRAAAHAAQAELQQLTATAATVYLAFAPGSAGEALAAVAQQLIRSGRARTARPPQILRVACSPDEPVTRTLLSGGAMVDVSVAAAYQVERVLNHRLSQQAKKLDTAAHGEFQQAIQEAVAQVAAGRADAESVVRDLTDQWGRAPVVAAPRAKAAPGCPRCGKPLLARQGTQGTFTGCSGYPKCRYVVEAATAVRCPECTTGQLVERRSGAGKAFYGCTRFPECRFTLTRKPLPGPCPECGNAYLVERVLKSGVRAECPQKDCGFRQALGRAASPSMLD